MTVKRWTTTNDGRWVECDSHGRPIPGAPTFERLPIRPGDRASAAMALRMAEQSRAQHANAASFADRLASTKEALGLSLTREFDPPRRAPAPPPRTPSREPEDPREIARRVEQAKRALWPGEDEDVKARAAEVRRAMEGG